MSVIRAKTNSYGPATIDIQIEQGADFVLPIQILVGATPLDITGYDISACFSPQWSPGAVQVPLTIDPVDLSTGKINVTFPAADSADLVLPFPPRKTTIPEKFELGGWILHVSSGGEAPFVFRYCEGKVVLDRAPWLT